ncbi:MAG: amidohydrolase family protein [Leptolinea sp.]|nr:amidohydrolase family protein [Leptolinea sp.]
MRIPGLIDPHVHMREPGGEHKEDWSTGTASALAGGVTMVLAMPNTKPPVTDRKTLEATLSLAGSKARCDFAQFIGAGAGNRETAASLAPHTAGLKMYLDSTYGDLKLDNMEDWFIHFQNWPASSPLCVHAEGPSLAAAILLAEVTNRPVHLCHISLRSEIMLIRAAKARGIPVTCEVSPHHLFLNCDDIPSISPGRSEVRPRLASRDDVQALWDNLDCIDCFATDHAPHTPGEKDSDNPPPGFPGLESALPLYLTAMSQGRLTLDDILARCVINPRHIFHLPEQPDTFVEIDPAARWTFDAAKSHTRSGWSPFDGFTLTGRIESVTLRGKVVYKNGEILAEPGSGHNIRSELK